MPAATIPSSTRCAGRCATRSIGRGLTNVEPEAGTLVVYAAKHGQVALDGDGGNSPFVAALTKRMKTPGLEVRRLFDHVRDDVLEMTNRKQQPFIAMDRCRAAKIIIFRAAATAKQPLILSFSGARSKRSQSRQLKTSNIQIQKRTPARDRRSLFVSTEAIVISLLTPPIKLIAEPRHHVILAQREPYPFAETSCGTTCNYF